MNLEYVKNGDYYVPNIELLKENKKVNLGKYGRMREQYLKEHRRGLFDHLMAKEELVEHLTLIDKDARKQVDMLVKQLAKEENVDENLKKTDSNLWIQMMNNIKNRAEEIVINELIYT